MPAPAPQAAKSSATPAATIGRPCLTTRRGDPLRSKMGGAVTQWNDARLSDLADVLEPVPVQVAVLDATVTHLAAAFEPMPAQIAVLTAAVDRLSCPCHRADLKRPPA